LGVSPNAGVHFSARLHWGPVSLRARLLASLPDRPTPIGRVGRQSRYGGTTPIHL